MIAPISLTRQIDRYALGLLCVFLLIWILLGINPHDREAWLMENVLTVVAVLGLIASHRNFRLSGLSYTLIMLFLCLHAVGAHFTYSRVPLGWIPGWLPGFDGGADLALRNNYDRLVHFSYGLLIAYPIREMFLRVVAVGGFWGYFLPLDLTLSTSLIYELLEWAVVDVFGGDLGMAFLGVQGDVWDAHKDMLMAGSGATLAMLITAAINIRLQGNFADEWADSLRVKRHDPLGETAILRMYHRARAHLSGDEEGGNPSSDKSRQVADDSGYQDRP